MHDLLIYLRFDYSSREKYISKLFQLIVYTYIYKIIFAIVAAPFISIIAAILKTKIDNQNPDLINFNSLNIIVSSKDISLASNHT